MANNSTPTLFTVYYMNHQKVFETRMLLDNSIRTSGSEEKQTGSNIEASLSAETEFNPPLLAKLRARLEGDVKHERQEKVVDTLEYVNTNSRMLSDIMSHCKVPENGTNLVEGNLVYIGGVSLELINEEEIRGIMAITSGTFNGITLPDAGNLDIGRMMQSFVKNGAAFKLKGSSGSAKDLFAKIPLDGEELFESKYTIDDLLIGKVGIVGICKGEILPEQMKSPLDYFQQPRTSASELQDDIIECGEGSEPPTDKEDDGSAKSGYYVDILAIIQAVAFETGRA